MTTTTKNDSAHHGWPSDMPCPPDGTWLTNTEVVYNCVWPIRYGEPMATVLYSAEELKKKRVQGVYICLPKK